MSLKNQKTKKKKTIGHFFEISRRRRHTRLNKTDGEMTEIVKTNGGGGGGGAEKNEVSSAFTYRR